MKELKNEDLVTWRIYFSMAMADIDIFLLQEEDQETDKDKLYTKEEIRSQLEKTLHKMLTTLSKCGFDIDSIVPISTSFVNVESLLNNN